MNKASVEADLLYSRYGADSVLGDLVDLFVAELPDRVAGLVAAVDAGDIQELACLAHQLKGASGSYGFNQLTAPAARLEEAAMQHAGDEEINRALEAFVSTCRRVRSGTPR